MAWRGFAFCAALLIVCCTLIAGERSFRLENDQFVKDGEPIQIFSGSIHYQRIHPEYWRDRLLRVKAMGLNAIQWYVTWNLHEPKPGVYKWDGFADVERFLEIANELNLMVFFRPGPYACGEWEFGGFPYWLASDTVAGGGTMTLRVSDKDFMRHVDRWWSVLLPKISRFLYSRGGPIVLAQIENEYGFCWRAPDTKYLHFLVDAMHKYLGDDVIIYSTDPPSVIQRGTLPGEEVYSVVDFGPGTNVAEAFKAQKAVNPPGKSPPLCSEYYTGWITTWGEPMANTSADLMMQTMTEIVEYSNNTGSVNLYMAHGGTNFGYWAGANVQSADPTPPALKRSLFASQSSSTGIKPDIYKPVVTTYDYDCPVSETGRTGQPGIGGPNKFNLIRELFTKMSGKAPIDFPKPLPLIDYGKVSLEDSISLMDALPELYPGDGIVSEKPERMENYDQAGGFIIYRTLVPSNLLSGDAVLDLGAPVHDYAQVLVNGRVQAVIERNNPRNLTLVPPADASAATHQLDIVLHALGRVNFGCIWDFKGLVNPDIKLNGQVLTGWRVFPLELTNLSDLKFDKQQGVLQTAYQPGKDGPVIYRGYLDIDGNTARGHTGHLPDTYISVRGWGKGLAFINGFNLGWYWPSIGPQGAQYVPGPLLKEGRNEVILVEIESAPKDESVDLVSEADLSGASDMIDSGKAGYMQSQPAPASFDRSMYLPSSEISARAPAKLFTAIQRLLGWI